VPLLADDALRRREAFDYLADGAAAIGVDRLAERLAALDVPDAAALAAELDRDGDGQVTGEDVAQALDAAPPPAYRATHVEPARLGALAPATAAAPRAVPARTATGGAAAPGNDGEGGLSALHLQTGFFRLLQGAACRSFRESYSAHSETHLRARSALRHRRLPPLRRGGGPLQSLHLPKHLAQRFPWHLPPHFSLQQAQPYPLAADAGSGRGRRWPQPPAAAIVRSRRPCSCRTSPRPGKGCGGRGRCARLFPVPFRLLPPWLRRTSSPISIIGMPWLSMRRVAKFLICRRRSPSIPASPVGASPPQFHYRLSSMPSRLSSPLAALCLRS
jgi:hypothetical protein